MKIKYTYKGSEYIEYIGVDSPDEQLAVLLGSDNSAGILGIAVAITSYSSTDVTVNFTGFNSEGRTQDSNDLALDILNWNFPHIDSDMVEAVPADAEIVITYLRYDTSDGSVISDMTPITIHSCSELRMKNGQEVPSIPNPYPVPLPQPGTGAVGSGTGGGDEPTPVHWSYTYYTQSSNDNTRTTLKEATDDGLSDLFSVCQIYGYREKYQRGWKDRSVVSKCFLISEVSSFVYDIQAGILNKEGLKAAIDGLVWQTQESTRLDGSKYYVETTYIPFLCEFYNPDTDSYSAIMGVGGVNLKRDI